MIDGGCALLAVCWRVSFLVVDLASLFCSLLLLNLRVLFYVLWAACDLLCVVCRVLVVVWCVLRVVICLMCDVRCASCVVCCVIRVVCCMMFGVLEVCCYLLHGRVM